MKKDPEMSGKLREVNLKQKRFIKKHMKTHQGRITHHDVGDDVMQDSEGSSGCTSRPEKRKGEEEAEDERLCEDNRVTTGMKRKAEVDIDLEIMCCMCEEPLEIHAASIKENWSAKRVFWKRRRGAGPMRRKKRRTTEVDMRSRRDSTMI